MNPVLIGGALAAALLVTGIASADVTDVTAARGFAFDQIERDVAPGTAPSPGAFPAQYAALAAAQNAYDAKTQAAQNHAKALGTAAGVTAAASSLVPVLGEAAVAASAAAARSAMAKDRATLAAAANQRFALGDLTHFDVLDGAVRRTESDGTVYISRPGEPLIRLDTHDRTYHRYTAAESDRAALAARFPGAGTADVHGARTETPLPAATIEGQPAHGSRVTVTFAFSNATGACPHADAHATETAYTIDRPEPDMMTRPLGETVVQMPCVARFDGGASAPLRMFVYRMVTTDAPKSSTTVTERGNFRLLGADAASLFAIPPDYKEE